MTQYNTLNVKLSNSQLNKLKSAIKNGTEVTSNHSSNLIGSSNDETNFPHKLLLNNTQVSKIRKAFANGSSANIKFSKVQLSKMIQSGGIICRYTTSNVSSKKRSIKKRVIISTKISTSISMKSKRILY